MKAEELKIEKKYWIEFIHSEDKNYSYTGVGKLKSFADKEFGGGLPFFELEIGVVAYFEPQYIIKQIN